MKISIALLLCFAFAAPLSAQISLDAELVGAYPLYFSKKEIGISSDGLHTGFRMGAYLFRQDARIVAGVRYTHFGNLDSAEIDASDRNYQDIDLYGTARVRFNSILPHIGWKWETNSGPLWSATVMVGMGIAWGKAEYDLPTYDSTSMSYFNPPWNRTGRFNAERKLVAVKPFMGVTANVYYELEYFYLFGGADIAYTLGSFPSSPLSASVGIMVPLDGKD